MSQSQIGITLMSIGAVLTVAGAAMYVLPGPGLPVLVVGLVFLAAGAVARRAGRERRG
ncbi:PGPGW domain-containing protein [Streptomyces sp. NPDC091376]|uniref:PGPGW domain-containing protein n=1 Tax=Streptomyces sp. NPDC091376 TaxID=3365994 RepID=UPI00381F6EFB